ncbi:uncharacterized protein LOC123292358 [Chrysoperla carnea]|uniref:uncharacterized protein LOC123292358 n=1 Tax=Chrysoperla carnea TaxID=189513 RepID=UPI001D067535|nr:uncharacterized protein LOC123292358 [Chrysoperla carnea]XP_044728920.1 uncharacterized protein LOC123292358 [Chrysoperla carnea]
MFRIQWLRRLIRRNTKPIPVQSAQVWKNRLSVIYALVAWNAFGCVLYMIYQGKKDWADYYGYKSDEDKQLSPGKQWAKTLGIPNAQIVRIKGLTVTETDEYHENTVLSTEKENELLEEGKNY